MSNHYLCHSYLRVKRLDWGQTRVCLDLISIKKTNDFYLRSKVTGQSSPNFYLSHVILTFINILPNFSGLKYFLTCFNWLSVFLAKHLANLWLGSPTYTQRLSKLKGFRKRFVSIPSYLLCCLRNDRLDNTSPTRDNFAMAYAPRTCLLVYFPSTPSTCDSVLKSIFH